MKSALTALCGVIAAAALVFAPAVFLIAGFVAGLTLFSRWRARRQQQFPSYVQRPDDALFTTRTRLPERYR